MKAWAVLADAVLVAHFGVALFIVSGVPAIIAGNMRGWAWVDNPWFRGAHLAAIVVVALESWMDVPCPLTVLEAWLREGAGGGVTEEIFAIYWMRRILFYEGPSWVFTAAYTAFGALVVGIWLAFPVRWRRGAKDRD